MVQLTKNAQCSWFNSLTWNTITSLLLVDFIAHLLESFDGLQSILTSHDPCYLIVKVAGVADAAEPHVSSNLFITYVPDIALVRYKMLYASTRSSLLKSLPGTSGNWRWLMRCAGRNGVHAMLGDEGMFVCRLSAVPQAPRLWSSTLQQGTWSPTNSSNRGLIFCHVWWFLQCGVNIGTSTKRAHVLGLKLPWSPEAADALQRFQAGVIQLVQMVRDMRWRRRTHLCTLACRKLRMKRFVWIKLWKRFPGRRVASRCCRINFQSINFSDTKGPLCLSTRDPPNPMSACVCFMPLVCPFFATCAPSWKLKLIEGLVCQFQGRKFTHHEF